MGELTRIGQAGSSALFTEAFQFDGNRMKVLGRMAVHRCSDETVFHFDLYRHDFLTSSCTGRATALTPGS